MMTTYSPAGGRAVESRDLAVALLASRLSEIGEHLGRLAARVEAAEASIVGHASLLATTSDLAREVSQLSATITDRGSPLAVRPASLHPRQPTWAAMNQTEYADALRDPPWSDLPYTEVREHAALGSCPDAVELPGAAWPGRGRGRAPG